MSDEHHEHDGGHELEALDPGQLFRVIGGLTIVVLISIIAVIQWFHKQQAELRTTRSDYTFLADHEAAEDQMLEGIAAVEDEVAKDATAMAPVIPPPDGWIHPDDIGGGTAAAGTPADGAEPTETPEEDEGAEGAEEAGDEAAEGEDAAAEGDAADGDDDDAEGDDAKDDADEDGEDDEDDADEDDAAEEKAGE